MWRCKSQGPVCLLAVTRAEISWIRLRSQEMKSEEMEPLLNIKPGCVHVASHPKVVLMHNTCRLSYTTCYSCSHIPRSNQTKKMIVSSVRIQQWSSMLIYLIRRRWKSDRIQWNPCALMNSSFYRTRIFLPRRFLCDHTRGSVLSHSCPVSRPASDAAGCACLWDSYARKTTVVHTM